MSSGNFGNSVPNLKVKIPELKSYDDTHDVNMFNNFMCDVEHYFKVAYIPEHEKSPSLSCI